MYNKLLKRILFSIPAEPAHTLTLNALKLLHSIHLLPKTKLPAPRQVMGLSFENPVGLAAGLDKNGDYIDALAQLGFGFIEIGTVTPRPQAGNKKPRLFRLPKDHAILNRMGFNNKGVDHLVRQVKKSKYRGILGINIGKNAATPMANAVSDYLHCLKKVYPYASYITVNISSPNTPGLRDLQHEQSLAELLSAIKQEQSTLKQEHNKHVPITIKISPDMQESQVKALAEQINHYDFEGVIATNTTLSRDDLSEKIYIAQAGGISGRPLTDRATNTLAILRAYLNNHIPIIAAGGVMSAADAQRKIQAGASLVQLYSGFIYSGPSLISDCVKSFNNE